MNKIINIIALFSKDGTQKPVLRVVMHLMSPGRTHGECAASQTYRAHIVMHTSMYVIHMHMYYDRIFVFEARSQSEYYCHKSLSAKKTKHFSQKLNSGCANIIYAST